MTVGFGSHISEFGREKVSSWLLKCIGSVPRSGLRLRPAQLRALWKPWPLDGMPLDSSGCVDTLSYRRP